MSCRRGRGNMRPATWHCVRRYQRSVCPHSIPSHELEPVGTTSDQSGNSHLSGNTAFITDNTNRNEWALPVEGLEEPLILDSHFLELTPLNDVDYYKHELE